MGFFSCGEGSGVLVVGCLLFIELSQMAMVSRRSSLSMFGRNN